MRLYLDEAPFLKIIKKNTKDTINLVWEIQCVPGAILRYILFLIKHRLYRFSIIVVAEVFAMKNNLK